MLPGHTVSVMADSREEAKARTYPPIRGEECGQQRHNQQQAVGPGGRSVPPDGLPSLPALGSIR